MNKLEMEYLSEKFKKHFGESVQEIKSFFAPGRVNLIGEHIDYNGGYVFPAALTIGITALVRLNNSDKIRMASLNIQGETMVDLKSENITPENRWGDYPKGVISYLREEGYELKGCDVLYSSTIPDGSGLSSSAAIEVLTTFMLLKISGIETIDKEWVAKFSQRVENEFVRVNCGIMDQFSVAMGKKDKAILLKCDSLKYKYIPLELGDYSLIIMNTNKKRGLSDSKYNERRKECDQALAIINKYESVNTLCDATLEQVEKYIKDATLKSRARHAITENKRVLDAIKALESGKLLDFASLLIASHNSLKHDYEVTGFELDTIVEEALNTEGCVGARMTGAGFGGCAIALIKTVMVDRFIERVSKEYEIKTKIKPQFYLSAIGEGVGASYVEAVVS